MTFDFIWSIKAVMTYLITMAILLADQWTKYLILQDLPQGGIVPILPGFNVVHARNRGVSFSLFSGDSAFVPWILSTLALAICAVLVWYIHREKRTGVRVGLALILGGAIGNVIDRVRFGSVIDFLDVYAYDWHWPAFNVADSAICLGVFLILILSGRKEKK